MKVRAVQLHTDADGGRIQAHTIYHVEEGRALELIRGGYVVSLETQDYIGWDQGRGRQLSPLTDPSHYGRERDTIGAPDVRVLQLTQYDPGSAAYRYHSAFNHAADAAEMPATSAFVRFGSSNPFCDLRQYDGTRQRTGVTQLFETADVVHVHMDYTTLDESHCMARWPERQRQLLVRHYHGSQSPESFNTDYRLVQQALDDQVGALLIGARLYHPRRYGRHITWIPIPMPTRDYAALRAKYWVPVAQRPEQRIRICHSSTNDRVKGTVVLDCLLPELMRKGWPIEYIKITNTKHQDCLRIKASCDITFDSFWLGIQGAGLEAGAMGQAVIAGDSQVRDDYLDEIGSCPYTFAQNDVDFPAVLERLVFDDAYRASEGARTQAYVQQYHDYSVVGAKYWALIDAALKERHRVAA